MEHFDYLIIGGGIAGTVAAETARSYNLTAKIGIITAESEPLYSRVMLVRYACGKLDRDRLFLRQKSDYARQRIQLLCNETVIQLNPEERVVTCKSGATFQYESLVIATGGEANNLDVPGNTLKGIHTFKSIEDADIIHGFASAAANAVVVGGGFVAMELVDVFSMSKAHVSIIIRETGFWEPLLGKRGSDIVLNAMRARGVDVRTNASVTEILGTENVTSVTLNSGETIPADVVALGIGQTYLQPWITDAGITTAMNAIATNEWLETNVPHVLAAGDAASFFDTKSDRQHRLGSWLNAQLHGMAAGASMAGKRTQVKSNSFYRASFGETSVVFMGDVRANDPKVQERIGEEHELVRIWEHNGKIVGAALVNYPQIIQTLQTAIANGKSIADVPELLAENFSK